MNLTKEINLFVIDTQENFVKTPFNEDDLGFKNAVCIDSNKKFEEELSKLGDEELLYVVVHAFSANSISGVKRFYTGPIMRRYPNISYCVVSEGDKTNIKTEMVKNEIPVDNIEILFYWKVVECLDKGTLKACKKADLKLASVGVKEESENNHYEYAIITALEEDEMEKILPFIEKKGVIPNDKHLIEYGHLKGEKSKKIVYVSQQATGMIDASILATEIIVRFTPKFLIMPGVLGGKPKDTKIGDIIVSKKVFTVDKGKLTDEEFQKEIESSNTTSSYVTLFERNKSHILNYINEKDGTRKKIPDIHFEPIACVRSVVDKQGYFVENISSVDRKVIGLEMESYGIARSCEIVNNGKTIPIIVKSVMDNTQEKTDDAKTYAAWTSAKFVQYILENDLI